MGKTFCSYKHCYYICSITLKQNDMKKFIKSETYIDKNGNTYSYDGKYRGYWQFFKHSDKNGLNGGLKTFNERQLLELELYLK